MIFVYKQWENFCKALDEKGIHSIPACEVNRTTEPYLVLKHVVETDVQKAWILAKAEQEFGHRGSYYVQAYLIEQPENIALLKEMQAMGHEISYHYDVMDACKGDIEKADITFTVNCEKFKNYGFCLQTVCQHGNPVVERIGYTSNRDFFRNETIQQKYSGISDIMVNYKEAFDTEYVYYSDAGRHFKMIFDPINNDIVNSDDKNIGYDDLNDLLQNGEIEKSNCIISTHPHRWNRSAVASFLKAGMFRIIKAAAKLLMKVPFMKKFMSRYYYLAKKI